MILNVSDLPSKGKYGEAPPIYIRPFKFIEILDYSNEVTGNSMKDYLRDIKWLKYMDENVLKHSLYDLDYLIFMMKVHTISDNKEFNSDVTCNKCKTQSRIEFNLGDFKFKDVDLSEKDVKRVVLNDFKYKISVPTIGGFLKVLNKYLMYNKVKEVDVVKIISIFSEFSTIPNDVERDILGAEREEIALLYLLESKYLTSVETIKRECVNCNDKRGMVIGIESLITDMFRDLLFNNPATESKVQFE